jgi:hypothetical protein
MAQHPWEDRRREFSIVGLSSLFGKSEFGNSELVLEKML